MPSLIAESLAQVISNGLRRKSIVDCYTWATKCRIMGSPWPGPYSDKYFPWTRTWHNCDDPKVVIKKAAQVGATEYALDRVFYTIDIRRIDCLYLLPSQTPDASNFSAGRFDPALEMSPYLSSLFSDVMNVGHKRAGSTNLYIRGTRSRSQLKSIPAGLIVYDELDEMTQKNLSLAEERQAGQNYYQQIKLSTPTIKGHGIDSEFESSTKEYFHFRCPSCSRFTQLIFPDCLVITADSISDPNIKNSHIICSLCKNKLPHETKHEYLSSDNKGQFVPSVSQGAHRGFHVNGLYSSSEKRHPSVIAAKTLKAKDDPTEEQELYNSIMGEVHEVEGARVSDNDIAQCLRDHTLSSPITPLPSSIITMGCDQGQFNHYYEIDLWLKMATNIDSTDPNTYYIPKVLMVGIINHLEELDRLIQEWNVNYTVLDANPSRREGQAVAFRHPGRAITCIYGDGITSRVLNIWSNEPTISVDRTSWLDCALGRFKMGKILLPFDLPEDYKKHIKAPVRVPGFDKHDNPIVRYVSSNSDSGVIKLNNTKTPDHYAHARTYAEIALKFGIGTGHMQTTQSPR